MIVSEKFYNILTEMLRDRPMSISSIARELKKNGYDHHRLILTGYLRALHDTGYLEEKEIPPSKVYTYLGKKRKDIYALIMEELKEIEPENRLQLGVYLLSSLLNRPCFKQELTLMGLESRKTKLLRESKDNELKNLRRGISRVEIPQNDPAYEIAEKDEKIVSLASEVSLGMLKKLLDLEGLKARYQQKKLSQDSIQL